MLDEPQITRTEEQLTASIRPVVPGPEMPGPYEGLADGWRAFEKQVKESGHLTGPTFRERYVAGPESSPDSRTWRTELYRPLIG